MRLNTDIVAESERAGIDPLIDALPEEGPSLGDVWRLMDEAWDDIVGNGILPSPDAMDRFYRHPVWLLNGLYTEQDPVSQSHRKWIAGWLARQGRGVSRILDFGGGFGTLARMIVAMSPDLRVEIAEPFPFETARRLTRPFGNAVFVDGATGIYDALVCLDVLEHMPDPTATLMKLLGSLRPGGYLIAGNAFRPYVKCHLSRNLHLHFSFGVLAFLMGLSRMDHEAWRYLVVYRKQDSPLCSLSGLRRVEALSRRVAPVLEILRACWLRLIGRKDLL